MRNNNEFEELGELAEDERKEYEAELDMIEEFGEFPEEEFDDGKFVLVEIIEDEEGFGFLVDPDEPYGEYFMHILARGDEMATGRAMQGLIAACEARERNVLAREIREFIANYKPTVVH
jgi:hypothetical protein